MSASSNAPATLPAVLHCEPATGPLRVAALTLLDRLLVAVHRAGCGPIRVVWAGEFGRTPFGQGNDGRDHNPFGFTIWMAGGGVKGGITYGATDEFGYKAVENKVEVHDLHATMLHLLGFDHTKLTYRFQGRDFRLTDVHGEVVEKLLA